MRYRDLAAALEWLQEAFGFERQVAVSDADGAVIYAQMTYGTSMLMLGAVRDTDLDNLMRQPDEVGGIETQSCYVVIEDADAHHARAVAAGAEVLLGLKSDGLGRRGYSCRDPQGHIWSFGTYNPSKASQTKVEPDMGKERPVSRVWPRLAAMAASMLLAGTLGWWLHASMLAGSMTSFLELDEAERAYSELSKVRAEKRAADRATEKLQSDLNAERRARAVVEAAVVEARREAAAEREAKSLSEKAAQELRDQIQREQLAKEAALNDAHVTEKKLAQEREAKLALEREAALASERAAGEQRAREAETPKATSAVQPSEASETSALGSQIETSATGTEPAAATAQSVRTSDPEQGKSTPGKVQSVARPRRAQSQATPKPRGPTYIVELADVPWPYSAWYKGR
jgi:uncharacterized glyoxalase superfamily protein PhnB